MHNDGAEAVKILYATADAPGVRARVPRGPIAPRSSVELPIIVSVPGGAPPGPREASLAIRTTHDAQRSLHLRVRHTVAEPPEAEPIVTECLGLAGWEGISEDLEIDPVEGQIARGSWTMPRPGETVRGPGAALRAWRSVAAGEDGWFADGALASGYAALEIVRRQDEVLILEAMGNHVVWVNGDPRRPHHPAFASGRRLRSGARSTRARHGRRARVRGVAGLLVRTVGARLSAPRDQCS